MAFRMVQPEYTGANRCYPCTVVNLVIAAVFALLVVGVGAWADFLVLGLIMGSLVALGSVLLIYFRGYLVPGTPALTRRYLPARVLALFGKEQPQSGQQLELDPEAELRDAGIVEPCETGDDLCLTPSFADEWQSEIRRLNGADTDRKSLNAVLDVGDGELTFEDYPGAFRARIGGDRIGTWESEAAFRADLASATVLKSRYTDWNDRSVEAKGQLLRAVRLFLDTCPSCEERLTFAAETVESCCSTHEVAALSCGGCGSRLFETRLP